MCEDIKFVLCCFVWRPCHFIFCFHCEFFVSNGIHKLDFYGLPTERNEQFMYGHVCPQRLVLSLMVIPLKGDSVLNVLTDFMFTTVGTFKFIDL